MAGAVPETVLKKRKRDDEWATKKAAQQSEARSKAKETRKEIFKRAEQYVKEYRAKVLALLCIGRASAFCGGRAIVNTFVEGKGFALVVRLLLCERSDLLEPK